MPTLPLAAVICKIRYPLQRERKKAKIDPARVGMFQNHLQSELSEGNTEPCENVDFLVTVIIPIKIMP